MTRTQALMFVNVAHFFDHFFLLIFPTAALAIAPAWGLSLGDALLLGTPLYVMFALGTLPAGWLGDRMDRVMLIAIFFIGAGLSSLGIALASGPLTMGLGLGALGLFAAIYHPVGLAHVTDIGLRSGRALAINGVFGNMGLAAGAALTGVLAQYVGWQSAFAVPGLMSVAIGAMMLTRQRQARAGTAAADLKTVRPAPNQPASVQWLVFGVICVSALAGGMIFNMVTLSLPAFLESRLADGGLDLAWVGASAGAIFAVAAFAQLPAGEFLDRIGARPVLLTLIACEVLLLLGLTQLTGWMAFAAALMLVTVIFAGIPITTWLVGHYLDASIRSRALSVEYVLSLGVGSAAVPVIAFIQRADLGWDVQFAGLAVASALIFVAGLFLPRGRVSVPQNA